MSDLGGFALSRISGDGIQRPVKGDRGVNPGRPCDQARQDSSFSGSKNNHARVNADEVITWLKPVGETQVNVFWNKYSFPLNVRVSFLLSEPQSESYTKEDRGVMKFIYWNEAHISEGLMFPLPALVH